MYYYMDYIGVIQKRGVLLWAREGKMEENELKSVLKRGVGVG